MRFVEAMKLPLQAKDRFSQEEKIFQIIEKAIGTLNSDDALALSQKMDCLSLVSL